MAKLIEDKVREVKGVEPFLRRAPELMPESVIQSRPDMKAGAESLCLAKDAYKNSKLLTSRFLLSA